MTDATPYETRAARSVQEMADSPYVDLEAHHITPLSPDRAEPATAVRQMSKSLGIPLDGYQQQLFQADEIHAIWRSVEGPLIVGEFCLPNLHYSFFGDEFPPEDPTLPAADYAKLNRLKIIDSEPHSGSGSITGIHVTEDAGQELWFYDAGLHRLERLDLDYRGYLDAVLLTKGTCGWQYLFADVRLGTSELHTTARFLQVMLEKFPEHFPRHDYTALRERLEARL